MVASFLFQADNLEKISFQVRVKVIKVQKDMFEITLLWNHSVVVERPSVIGNIFCVKALFSLTHFYTRFNFFIVFTGTKTKMK